MYLISKDILDVKNLILMFIIDEELKVRIHGKQI